MMTIHKVCDISTKVNDSNKEKEDCYHKWSPIFFCPISKYGVIRMKVFCLKNRKWTNNENEKERKYAWFRNSSDHIRRCFCKSFFQHLKSCKEDNEESEPLNRWIFFQHSSDPSRGKYHKDNREYESNSEIYVISVRRSSNRKNVIERHGNIGNHNHLNSTPEIISPIVSIFCMFLCTNFSIELPYNIEKKDSTEELKSRNLQEEYDSKRKEDTKNSSTSYSPEYCFFTSCSFEFFCCHPNKNSIITTHNEIDENDIKKRKESSTGCKCLYIVHKHIHKILHRKNKNVRILSVLYFISL